MFLRVYWLAAFNYDPAGVGFVTTQQSHDQKAAFIAHVIQIIQMQRVVIGQEISLETK